LAERFLRLNAVRGNPRGSGERDGEHFVKPVFTFVVVVVSCFIIRVVAVHVKERISSERVDIIIIIR